MNSILEISLGRCGNAVKEKERGKNDKNVTQNNVQNEI